jgi:hypothetical protein
MGGPNQMVAGPHAAMWFTDLPGNAVGKMTTAVT